MNKFFRLQKALPLDYENNALQITLSSPALAFTHNNAVSSSANTNITLNAGTVLLEVSALDTGILMRYDTTAITTSNAQEYILPNTTRHFAIREGITAVGMRGDGAAARVRVIEK